MKKIILSIVVCFFAVEASFIAIAADMREHRAVWTSPYVSDWPAALTTSNAERQKENLCTHLDKLKACNVNIIYYHARANCDATYESAYEPWSSSVSGKRGATPIFDPFAFLLEEAHARGIEVYAWFNPYRYCYTNRPSDPGDTTYDEYLYDHPEWLLIHSESIHLNPALEVVKQRVCDVIKDLIIKYDVDGVVFDDYFYNNPCPAELDADLYNAAKAADPNVGTQIEWRVANVNEMVDRVNDVIKATKPYLVFGIAPAGVASPPNIEEKYGLNPISGDWQYNSIASDPLNWYKEKNIDFMGPQIYWPGERYDEVQAWWAIAARKFGRHLYSAISLSDHGSTYGNNEFNREIEYARTVLPENESGQSFFKYSTLFSSRNSVGGKNVYFNESLAERAYSLPALTPLRAWHNVYAPAYISGLKRDGNVLSWDAVEGMRYTIYSFDADETQRAYSENLVAVRYTNSYEIPADMTDKIFGVAVYDRYGNEYSMLTEGATLAEGKKAVLTYPENGKQTADLFDFAWEDPGCDVMFEVAADASFAEVLYKCTTNKTSVPSFNVPNLVEGNTYYWRVTTHGVNSKVAVSDVRSFIASRVTVTTPTSSEESLTPTITWTAAYAGSTYLVEVSRSSTFSTVDFSAETSDASVAVPAGILKSGRKYNVRVTASRNGYTSVSDVVSFSTVNIEHEAPKFVNPQTEGATIHSNQSVIVEDWVTSGMNSITVQISENADFPARKSYKFYSDNGEVSTPELSTIRVASKTLVDGNTYYVRVYGSYYVMDETSSTEKDTEYTMSSFVYSSAAGVSDIIVDGKQPVIDGEQLVLPVVGNDVNVYAADGTCVMSVSKAGLGVDLSELSAGLYIVKVSGLTPATLKWVK